MIKVDRTHSQLAIITGNVLTRLSLLAEEQLSFETGVAVDELLVWSARFNSSNKGD